MGSLSSFTATELGAMTVKETLKRSGVGADEVDELIMGLVIGGGCKQNPTKQVAVGAGLDKSTITSTVNKVCASGLKAIMNSAFMIGAGYHDIMIAGGMESMSNAPFLIEKMRTGIKAGHGKVKDTMFVDGLEDAYTGTAMGFFADATAVKYDITREQQDEWAIGSYIKAAKATEEGLFKNELFPITVKSRRGETIVEDDEEFTNINFEKVPNLRPCFEKDGTVTAANASTISDGAASVMLMSDAECEKRGIKPICKILGVGDGETDPEWFTVAPGIAMQKALDDAGLTIDDIDFFEINEAFAVVTLANAKNAGLDLNKVNVRGGACALGHPLGCSGARIVVTMMNILEPGQKGLVGICNGGGGAGAMVIEKC